MVVVPFTSWQEGSVPAPIIIAVGVATVGVIVTVCEVELGPLQPEAVAVMMLVPDHPGEYVTCPVEVLMVLPAPWLVASRVYAMLVLLLAVAVYDTGGDAWQMLELAPKANTGVPTDGLTVSTAVAEVAVVQV